MNSDAPLNYALFQLSPRRSRCELLFVSGDGKVEKLASGLFKPFVTHLKVAEEQASQSVKSIKLEAENNRNASAWFNKGTLERFVRFVSTPEVLELVTTFDSEMTQLEGARRIYSQGAGDQNSSSLGESEKAAAAAADITKKELLRAIDLRLGALNQDLFMACGRAVAAGFSLENVSEVLLFAEYFGAHRLHDACTKFISLCQRRPELISHHPQPPLWKGFEDGNIRSSSGSDMSIDEAEGAGIAQLIESNKPSSSNSSQPPIPAPESGQRVIADSVSTCHQPQPVPQCSVIEGVEKPSEDPSPSTPFVEPAKKAGGGGGSRRLSVQDRINLFESKQKELSGSANSTNSVSSSGGINKVGVGKGEPRRLLSDMSVEKSVLRRWSGASDMSIDVSNNNSGSDVKDSGGAVGTPSSSGSFHCQSSTKLVAKESVGFKDAAMSKSSSVCVDNSPDELSTSSSQIHYRPIDSDEYHASREHIATSTKTGSDKGRENHETFTSGSFEQGGLSGHVAPQIQSRYFAEPGDGAGSKDSAPAVSHFKSSMKEHAGGRDQAFQKIPSRLVSAASQAGSGSQASDLLTGAADGDHEEDQQNFSTQLRPYLCKTEEIGGKSNGYSNSQIQFEVASGNSERISLKSSHLTLQLQSETLPGIAKDVNRKERTSRGFQAEEKDDSGFQGKLQMETSGPDQIRNSHGRKVESRSFQGDKLPASRRKVKEDIQVINPPSTLSVEQVKAVRPSKGNQELNDELQVKANELEKLFAAHKLRAHGDQMASSRRSKSADIQIDHVPKFAEKRPSEAFTAESLEKNIVRGDMSNGVEFNASLLLKMVDNQDHGNNMKQKLGNCSPSGDSRGKFYDKYMLKRDAKLKEEWGSNRLQKEAKMKAMHDSLERSQAEMKAKFSGFANKQDLDHARRRMEKLRSFNSWSAMRNKDEKKIEAFLGEEEEDLQEDSEQSFCQDKFYNGTLFGDGSVDIRTKFSSGKNLSSFMPRTSGPQVSRTSVKAANSGSTRPRTQTENALAQSVPNFSDFRKENTRPAGASKLNNRAQSRLTQSKSISEDTNNFKEEKPRRSQSKRKSSALPGELKDISPLNSDSANLASIRFLKEQAEQNKIQKSGEPKTFLKKGNGIGPGAGAGRSKLKASMASEILNLEEECEESEMLVAGEQNSSMLKGDVESGRASTAESSKAAGFAADSDNDEPRFSQESDNSHDLGSENGDVLRSPVQVDDDPAANSFKLNVSADNVQESPEESPGSWNSHKHHPFSYAHEASDFDASIDSPTGSPASWNSHRLNQIMEADAARMRKKWGSAQIPVLVPNVPHQSRRDVTKGFKRLLKFGRKSRGAESLITDWVSASTASEGDDDTEDGHDLANRSSDDLRKSRMGYSMSTYDGFNEGDMFPEQAQSLRTSIPTPPANFRLREDHLSGSSLKAPRSFFSLSTFRGKGGESKLR